MWKAGANPLSIREGCAPVDGLWQEDKVYPGDKRSAQVTWGCQLARDGLGEAGEATSACAVLGHNDELATRRQACPGHVLPGL